MRVKGLDTAKVTATGKIRSKFIKGLELGLKARFVNFEYVQSFEKRILTCRFFYINFSQQFSYIFLITRVKYNTCIQHLIHIQIMFSSTWSQFNNLKTKNKPLSFTTWMDSQKIKDYVLGDSKEPLIVHGESGCGKTSIMALAAREAFSWIHGNGMVIMRWTVQIKIKEGCIFSWPFLDFMYRHINLTVKKNSSWIYKNFSNIKLMIIYG